MSPADGWLTKTAAAQRAGVDERTIERWARYGKIGAQARPGFPTLYRQDTIDEVVAERRTGVRPVILPAGGNGHAALQVESTVNAPWQLELVHVLQAARLALAPGPTPPTGPTSGPTGPTPDDWMTPFAVARAWRWPRRVVLKMVEEGLLGDVFYLGTPAHPRAVVRRSAVVAFAAGESR